MAEAKTASDALMLAFEKAEAMEDVLVIAQMKNGELVQFSNGLCLSDAVFYATACIHGLFSKNQFGG